MFRKEIEDIRKQRRSLSKIQGKVNLITYLLSKEIEKEFKIRWVARFGDAAFQLTPAEKTTLLIHELESGVTFDDVILLCRSFTHDTGVAVQIEYVGLTKLSRYITESEEEEEWEL